MRLQLNGWFLEFAIISFMRGSAMSSWVLVPLDGFIWLMKVEDGCGAVYGLASADAQKFGI
jgi:hypothetical protein